MGDFKVIPEQVSVYFHALAKRDFFDDVVVIGRFKSDAVTEEMEDGYNYYAASSTTTPRTIEMIKDAVKEWKLDG